MAIARDAVEMTGEYQEAMVEIQKILDQEFPADQIVMGTCHRFWARKKELLARKGIRWKSPAEMNPDVRFD